MGPEYCIFCVFIHRFTFLNCNLKSYTIILPVSLYINILFDSGVI